MPLAFGSEVKPGVVTLRNPDGVEPLNLWKAFVAADFRDLSARKLDIEVWKISASKERLDAFLPGDVRVVLADPPLIFKLHRPDGVGNAGERLPVHPVPRGERVAPLLWSSAAPRQQRMPRLPTTGDDEFRPLLAQAIADLDLVVSDCQGVLGKLDRGTGVQRRHRAGAECRTSAAFLVPTAKPLAQCGHWN